MYIYSNPYVGMIFLRVVNSYAYKETDSLLSLMSMKHVCIGPVVYIFFLIGYLFSQIITILVQDKAVNFLSGVFS